MRILFNIGNKIEPFIYEFILKIDTTLGDGLNQMRMPLQSTQPMEIDWGDGTVETVTQTATPASDNWITHTYPSAGIYDIKVSNVDMVKFANEGDKFKPLEVLSWGTYGVLQAIQDSAFYGCENLTEIADNGDWFDIVTSGFAMFANNSLTLLPTGMTLESLTNGFAMFFDNSLTSLPTGMTLESLTVGRFMFRLNDLTSLPSGMELPLLTNGSSMFSINSLTSLPTGMKLPLLTSGDFMFRENSLTSLPVVMTLESLTSGNAMFFDNSLTSLPTGMTLESLTNGRDMFRENSLTSLPTGMTLEILTNGNTMFFGNDLTSLPSGMTLESLTNGSNMFRVNSITSLPSVMTLESLTNGANMFNGNTLNTDALSSLYIKMSVLNPNDNVPFHGGSGNFDPAYTEVIDGVTYNTGDARADLVSRGWTLTDAGAI